MKKGDRVVWHSEGTDLFGKIVATAKRGMLICIKFDAGQGTELMGEKMWAPRYEVESKEA